MLPTTSLILLQQRVDVGPALFDEVTRTGQRTESIRLQSID